MTRSCKHCAEPLPSTARSHAKYCDVNCRMAASRARARAKAPKTPEQPYDNGGWLPPLALPAALIRHNRWIRRSAAKLPLTVMGDVARSNEPATWSGFAAAADSSAGVGLGFVLNGDGIVCVDLDHVLRNGVLSDAAEAFLATLPPTYIEMSPSGDGLHVWGRGMVLTSRKLRVATMDGEIIGARKYVTMTGDRFRNAPLTLANIAAQASPLIY